MTLSVPFFGGRLNSALGVLGRPVGGNFGAAKLRAARAATGAVANVWEVTCTAPTAATLYSISGTLDSDTSITAVAAFTAATTSAADLRDGLIAAWNASPILRGLAVATAKSTGTVVVLTAVTPGVSGNIAVAEVADSTSDLSISETTPGAAAASFAIGRFVARSGATMAGQVQGEQIAALTAAAGPVVVFTIDYGATTTYSAIGIAQDADGRDAGGGDITWVSGANLAAAVAAGVTALDAAYPDATITSDAVAGTITLAFPVGWSYTDLGVSATGAGGEEDIEVAVTPGSQVQTTRFVYDAQDQSPVTLGGSVTSYSADSSIPVVVEGMTWYVEDPGETITSGAPVYVETADGANKGRPYVSAAASRVRHPFATWYLDDTVGLGAAISLDNA